MRVLDAGIGKTRTTGVNVVFNSSYLFKSVAFEPDKLRNVPESLSRLVKSGRQRRSKA